MNRLTFLNIYEDTILDARETANLLIEEASDLLDVLEEHETNAPFYGIDLDGEVVRALEDTVNVYELTNSIINAYFHCSTEIVMRNSFFEKHGISFDWYVNGDNSDIEVWLNKGDTKECQTYYSGTLTDMVKESLTSEVLDKYLPLVEEFLSGTGVTFERKWIEDELLSLDIGEFLDRTEELYECVNAGELSEKLKDELREDLCMEER